MAGEDEQFASIRWDDDQDRPALSTEGEVATTSSADDHQTSSVSRSTFDKSHDNVGAGQASLRDQGSSGAYATPAGAGRAVLKSERVDSPRWQGYLMVQVYDPHKEGATGPTTAASETSVIDEFSVAAAAANGGMTNGNQGKDVHVSYGVRAETNLPYFDRTRILARRRYRDFEFLHDALQRDLPACLVPPLPDKHRLEYVTGDRFSPEFIERRTQDLQNFLERVCRHPHLVRMPILRSFLESSEWTVDMHAHSSASRQAANESATGDANKAPGMLDNWSDAIVNVFAKVKKPDDRFVALYSDINRFEEGISAIEHTVAQGRNRASDLSLDYEELSTSLDALAELETGMSPVLHRFSGMLAEFSRLQRLDSAWSDNKVLAALQALIAYGHAYKQLLRARENKQVDFEELTDYLSTVVTERERLGSLASPRGTGLGPGGVRGAGITSYLRDQVDAWRGVDEERTRVERMQRLERRTQDLQDAVANSHEVLQSFSNQVLSEALLFEYDKQQELQGVLQQLAQSKVQLYSESVQKWDRLLDSLGANKS